MPVVASLFITTGASWLILHLENNESDFLKSARILINHNLINSSSWETWLLWAGGASLLIIVVRTIKAIFQATSGRRWRYFLFLPGAVFLAFLFNERNFYSLLPLWLVTTYVFWPSSKGEELIKDKLFRSFYSEKIAKHFETKSPNLRRIAIIGPWGEGKTTLLKLLKQRLETSELYKFRTAIANPWKAETPEQAWNILAEGFEMAMGPHWLFPRTWYNNKLFRALFSFLNSYGLKNNFLQVIRSNFPENAEDYIHNINKQVKQSGVRLVLLVDDMERASPEVIRSLLPVIDKLEQFKECFFVFAIDPERMQAAFASQEQGIGKWEVKLAKEQTTASTEGIVEQGTNSYAIVQGYLDKVIDIQLTLPPATQREIAGWVRATFENKDKQYQKLSNSLPDIELLLPTNPRQCLKFLNIAEMTEALFLGDYSENEQDYIGLFIALMANSEFPNFGDALSHEEGWLSSFRISSKVGNTLDEIFDSSGFNEFCDRIKINLKLTDEGSARRLQQLLKALCTRIVHSESMYGLRPFDLNWILFGYRKRLRLPSTVIENVKKQWRALAGVKSLRAILEGVLSKDHEQPSEVGESLFQVLEYDVNTIAEDLRIAKSSDTKADIQQAFLSDAIAGLKCFQLHSKIRRAVFDDIEKFVFDSDLFKSFIDLVRKAPIAPDGPLLWNDVLLNRKTAMLEIALAISFEKRALLFSLGRVDLDIIRDPVDRKNIKIELDYVRNEINKSLIADVIPKLSKEGDPIDYLLQRFTGVPFLEPDQWVPVLDQNFDLTQLQKLTETVRSQPILQHNLGRVVEFFILHPLIPRTLRTEYSALPLIVGEPKYRAYIRAFWIAATVAGQNNPAVKMLLSLREEVVTNVEQLASKRLESQNQLTSEKRVLLTKELIDEVLPLPELYPDNGVP